VESNLEGGQGPDFRPNDGRSKASTMKVVPDVAYGKIEGEQRKREEREEEEARARYVCPTITSISQV
jgi:hypothetical protein